VHEEKQIEEMSIEKTVAVVVIVVVIASFKEKKSEKRKLLVREKQKLRCRNQLISHIYQGIVVYFFFFWRHWRRHGQGSL